MLKHYPLIGIAISFILGIIFQSEYQISFYILGVAFLLSIVVSLLFIKLFVSKIITIPYIVFALIPVFFFGALLYFLQNRDEIKYPIKENYVKEVKVVGRISEIELKRKNDFKFKLVIDSFFYGDKKITGNYLVVCRVKADMIKISVIFTINLTRVIM